MVIVEFAQSEKYSLSTDIFFFFKNCTCLQVKRAQQSEQGVQFLLYVQSVTEKKKMSVDVFGKTVPILCQHLAIITSLSPYHSRHQLH